MSLNINYLNYNRIPVGIDSIQKEELCVLGYSNNAVYIIDELAKFDIKPSAILITKEYFFAQNNNHFFPAEISVLQFEEYISTHTDISLILSIDPYRHEKFMKQLLEIPQISQVILFFGCDLLYGHQFEFLNHEKIKYIDNYYKGVIQRGLDIDFFERNINDFKETYNWLEDDLSREVMRCYLDGHINLTEFPMIGVWKGKDSVRNQYFEEGLISLQENEVFVDCGAYDGDTYRSFTKRTIKYKKYYLIEPDSRRFEDIKKNVNDCSNVIVINEATWDSNCELNLSKNKSCGEIVEQTSIENSTCIKANRLDNLIDDKPTFIKMDVEGAELMSLRGGGIRNQ